jgi:hypothetical protein
MALQEKVQVIEPEEGFQLLDAAARRYLHISGEEFLRRWDNGDYANEDTTELQRVAVLILAARQ